jgi:ribonucleoside-diphosphate reductase beta chain
VELAPSLLPATRKHRLQYGDRSTCHLRFLAFEAGEVAGMTPADIKAYIRFIADWRLKQLGLPAVYEVKENPLPWLQSMLSGVEHANFFEARSTEYSKAATRGQWHGGDGVWAAFDAMQAKRAGPEGMPAE